MPFFNDGREAALHQHVLSQDQNLLRNNPQAVLDTINAYTDGSATGGKKHHMMTFQSAKITKSHEILERMNPKPKIILELGTYVGNSTLAWANMLKEWWGDDTEALNHCQVYTCELEESFCGIARDFVALAGLEGLVSVEQGRSEDTIRRLVKEGKLERGGVDMLFVDHWEDAYLPDLKVVEELGLLRKGGVVVADNTDMPGAPEYLVYVKGSERYRSETVASMTEEEAKKMGGKRGKVPNLLEVSWVL